MGKEYLFSERIRDMEGETYDGGTLDREYITSIREESYTREVFSRGILELMFELWGEWMVR